MFVPGCGTKVFRGNRLLREQGFSKGGGRGRDRMLKLAFTTPATIIQLFQTTQTPKYAASTHRSYTSLKTSKVKIINPSLIHEKVKSPMRNYDRRTDVRKDNLMHCSLSKSLNFIPSLFPSLKTMSFKGSASQLNKFVLKDSPHI